MPKEKNYYKKRYYNKVKNDKGYKKIDNDKIKIDNVIFRVGRTKIYDDDNLHKEILQMRYDILKALSEYEDVEIESQTMKMYAKSIQKLESFETDKAKNEYIIKQSKNQFPNIDKFVEKIRNIMNFRYIKPLYFDSCKKLYEKMYNVSLNGKVTELDKETVNRKYEDVLRRYGISQYNTEVVNNESSSSSSSSSESNNEMEEV